MIGSPKSKESCGKRKEKIKTKYTGTEISHFCDMPRTDFVQFTNRKENDESISYVRFNIPHRQLKAYHIIL